MINNKTILTATLLVCSLVLAGCNPFQPKAEPTPTPMNTTPAPSVSPSAIKSTADEPVLALNTKNGQIVLKLYKKDAPNSVANFMTKANSGFYKNLTFHRVEPEFVVQGGDPLGNGTGGGKIASEINSRPFVRGSVGLARGMDKAISNDSQFFICLTTEQCQHLTNEYVNIGEVIWGMENVDKIAVGDKIESITSQTK